MAIIMLCMHTSRSLKGSALRQNGHLKSATAAVAETSAPLWVNLTQKSRSSAGSRRRWEQRRVHSGHRRRRQQAVHMSMSLLHPYISQQVSRSGAASWLWLGQLLSAGACAPGIGSAEGCGASLVCVGVCCAPCRKREGHRNSGPGPRPRAPRVRSRQGPLRTRCPASVWLWPSLRHAGRSAWPWAASAARWCLRHQAAERPWRGRR